MMAEQATAQSELDEFLTSDWQELRTEHLSDSLLEELTGDELDDDSVRVYHETLEAEGTQPTHAHGDPQVLVVTEGELRIFADGDIFDLEEGEAFILPSLTPNRMEAGEEEVSYMVVSRR